MKKKLTALVLALTLCMGLIVPIFAEEEETVDYHSFLYQGERPFAESGFWGCWS